jgi:hypothetical protein
LQDDCTLFPVFLKRIGREESRVKVLIMLFRWQTVAAQGRLKPKNCRLSGKRFPAAGKIGQSAGSSDNSIHLRG